MTSTDNREANDARVRLDQWAFLVACAALPLMQWGVVWNGSWIYAADGLVIIAGVLWAVAAGRRRTTVRFNRFAAAVLAYLTACMLAAAFSMDRRTSFLKLLIDVYVGGLALLTYQQVDTLRMLRKWVWASLTGTAIAAGAGLWGVVAFYGGMQSTFVGAYGSLPAGDYPRVVGTFLNFNMLCNYLSVGVLLALGAKKAGWVRGAMAWPIAVAAGVAAAFTVSPGLGGLLLGVALWMWAVKREKWTAVSWLLSGVAAAMAFLLATMVSPTNLAEPSSRLLCWEEAAGMVRAHPLLGAGTGMPVSCPGWVDATGGVQHLKDAHNLYLNIAAQKGLLGLAAFLSIAWAVLRSVRFRVEGSGMNVLAVALAIAVIEAVLYQGLSSSFEHTRHLWVLMGVLAAVREVQEESVLNDGSLRGPAV